MVENVAMRVEIDIGARSITSGSGSECGLKFGIFKSASPHVAANNIVPLS